MSLPVFFDRVGISPSLYNSLQQIARRATDATIDFVCRHKSVPTSSSSTIAGTSSETNFDVGQVFVPKMFIKGAVYHIVAGGVLSTTGTPTLQFKLLYGSTVLLTFTAQTCRNNASNDSWMIDAYITVKTVGSSGTIRAMGTLFFQDAAADRNVENIVNVNTISLDTTTPQTLQVSATWGTSSASNATIQEDFIVFLTDYV